MVSDGRKFAFIDRSMLRNSDIAVDLGTLSIPDGSLVDLSDLVAMPDADTGIISTGSQGEPFAALSLMSAGQHRSVSLNDADTVIISATPIPGNEKKVSKVINNLYRAGVSVFHGRNTHVHVSGHAAAEELKTFYNVVRPDAMVPVHGEYRQLDAHARIAANRGMDRSRIKVIRTGDLLALNAESIEVVDRIEVRSVLLDAQRQVVERSHLRERRRMGFEGIVIPVVTVGARSGKIAGSRVVTRGFGVGPTDGESGELEGVLAESLKSVATSGRIDAKSLEDRVRADLRRYLRRRMGRRPLVLPLIVEF